jgi:hypothetical protein
MDYEALTRGSVIVFGVANAVNIIADRVRKTANLGALFYIGFLAALVGLWCMYKRMQEAQVDAEAARAEAAAAAEAAKKPEFPTVEIDEKPPTGSELDE